jgi:hypothetical protein
MELHSTVLKKYLSQTGSDLWINVIETMALKLPLKLTQKPVSKAETQT